MRAASTANNVRRLGLGLLAGFLALALGGMTVLTPAQASANLSLPAIADGQTNGPSGGGGTTG